VTVTTATEQEEATGAGPAPVARRGLTVVLVAVIAVALVALGGGLAVALGIGRTDTPGTASVDAGFSRDMSTHHLQAVEMANLAQTHSSDPQLQQLAFDIASTQNNQVGRMRGWLSLWGLPLSDDGDLMSWMSSGGHGSMSGMSDAGAMQKAQQRGALMPGMASENDLTQLRSLTGRPFDVLFLQLMIRHHEGGVAMAEYGAGHAQEPAVRNLAQTIMETQAAEVTTMEQMLRADGGAPLPAD
jgi:uncharacterized protein (DUF305 family)